MATIQERLNKMKNSGPAISSNVREFQDTRTEEEKRAVNQAARDRAAGKVMSSLENQRRQAQVDMDIDTMNALDARMKAIRASAGQQTFGDRVSDVLSTAASRTGNAIASAVGTVSNAYNDPDYNRRQIAQAQKALETGRTSDGKLVTPAMRQTLQDSIDRMNQEIADWESANSFTNRAYTAANTMRDDSRKHEESAKQGLGKAGQFAVDVGVAGAQMAGDVLASAIVPGSGLALMGVRSFGAGAQEARDNGASIGQQMAYGAGSAALSVATEKIANVAAPFKKAFGDGILEKAIPGVIRKLSGSAAGKAALSMISEGGEEMLEDLLQPILQRATYDPEALVNYKNADYWTNMLYDGLVGAALGGVGAGVEQISNRAAGNRPVSQNTPAGDMPVDAESNSMGAAENAVQGVSGGVMEQEAQRLFGNNNPPAQGTGYAATELGRPSSPLGVSATQEDTSSVAPSGGNASANMDPLLELLTGGKRVGMDKLTDAQAQQADAGNTAGTIGMDADSRLFRIDPAQHIDQRGAEQIADRSVNAFQYDHPQLHAYYKGAAESMLTELSGAVKGGETQTATGEYGQTYSWRNKRNASPRIASLLDGGMTYADIETALDAIIHDKGQENYANAKRVEMVLDDMLTNGYNDGTQFVLANQQYIAAKDAIAGSQADSRGHGLDDIDADMGGGPAHTYTYADTQTDTPTDAPVTNDGLGAADAGFTTQGMEGVERTSRFADSNPYNQYQEAATGLTAEDYAKIFRYQSQTEQKSMYLAEELLYLNKDGKRTFIRDIDEASYQELAQSLRDATAWNGPQMDAAYMIKNELQGRSANMEIPSEEYTEWLSTMREHETAGGQGVQANAKWTRSDNQGGKATELDAWNNLQDSNLTEDQKQETFRKIVQWDMEIEGVKNGDTASLKDIILRVGQERGVLNALTGQQSNMLTSMASKALDSLTFDQLKQFAYSSTAALSTDRTPADMGQKIKTIQILNMLSSPKTPAKNLTGNTSFYCLDAVSMDGAAILDMAVSKLTGTRSVAFERAALGKESLRDAVKAMQMSIAEITLDVDMGSEKTRYGTGSSRTFKASGNLFDRVMSTLERNQAYLLTATDEFYKGAARGTEKATQSLIDQGKIKTTDKEYAAKQADQLAKYRTFQDDTKISVAIQQVHDILNLIGVGDSGKTIKGQKVHAFGLGDFLSPFTRVAGNLASRGLEYSPVNAVKGTLEIAQQVANAAGGKAVDVAKQAKGVSDMARGMTGTAIAYGFMQLVKSGLMRKADDEADEDVAALNQSEGMTGTQLNISAAKRALSGGSAEWQDGDTLIDLSSIEPLNLLMDLGAEMAKDPGNPIVSSFKATGKSFASSSADLPVAQGIGSIAKDVLVYKKDPVESIAEQFGRTAVSSVTPNILNALAKGMDDRPRNVYTGDSLADNLKDYAKSRIPGLRETLPGSVNTMGEAKTYQSGQTDNFLNALINPVGVNTYSQSDVSKEMQKVRESTGDATFYPTKRIPSELEYTDKDGNKRTKNLSYEERQAFQRDRGTYTMTTYADVMGTSAYKKANGENKAELLNLAGKYAYQLARANVLGTETADNWVMNAKNAKNDLKISTGEFIALYQKYGSDVLSGKAYEKTKQAVAAGLTVDEYAAMKDGLDADGNGGVSQAEAQAYLDGQGFTTGQKADLWTIINKSWKKNPYQ